VIVCSWVGWLAVMAAAGSGRPAVAVGAATAEFELEFRLAEGGWRRERLLACSGERFEDALPARPFCFRKGQESFAGWWWAASTGRHVGFESWLERDHLMLLDRDRDVVAMSSQPFWLRWRDGDGRQRRHAPDFFARRADGTGVVVDVRPDDRIPEKDAAVFELTAAACTAAGWEFRRAGGIDPVLAANVRWLSRYRHPRCLGPAGVAVLLMDVFAEARGLFAGAALAGERLLVLPVLFHLLWHGRLAADLAHGPLGPATLVRAGGPG
jgi:TnsA endonuclease-like protein